MRENIQGEQAREQIDFLWLELTNQCNLQCSHCYADSGPLKGTEDRLGRSKYQELIVEAYELGCRRLQFIGGEPTLNSDLPDFIELASKTGYSFLEVFTNLTRIPSGLLLCFKQHGVQVATSVYASSALIHDKITHLEGSFEKTTNNLKMLLREAVPVRVGVIELPENLGTTDVTVQFVRSLGVQNVGTDRLRFFGRGGENRNSELSELCGGCAQKTLCVGSDGRVSPCIMSKAWTIGSVLNGSLAALARSEQLLSLRSAIYSHTGGSRNIGIHDICTPKTCSPYSSCNPSFGPGPCAPSGCNPCFPKG